MKCPAGVEGAPDEAGADAGLLAELQPLQTTGAVDVSISEQRMNEYTYTCVYVYTDTYIHTYLYIYKNRYALTPPYDTRKCTS